MATEAENQCTDIREKNRYNEHSHAVTIRFHQLPVQDKVDYDINNRNQEKKEQPTVTPCDLKENTTIETTRETIADADSRLELSM